MKKIAVIGSGFAGLTSAIELASLGYKVTVLEKNSTPGGRARKFESNGFTFDMGPSWYWMPDVFDKFFARHGKKVEDYYNLLKLDPGFSVVYGKDNTIDVPASFEELVALFENIEKGSGSRLKRFLKRAAVKYKIGMDSLVYKPSHSIFEFINLKVLIGVLYLDVFSNFRSYVKKYFSDSRLTRLMEFPVLFLGATPQNTPALYSLMNYSAFSQGTYYPMGGFHEIIIGLSKLAKEKGVIINCDSNVEKINVVNGKVENIVVNGEKLLFDGVIASADYHHVEQKLLEKPFRNYTTEYWEKREMSPSSLLFYVGLDKRLNNLQHHNLFFDADFDQHAKEIYDNPKWPKNPLFYLSCPSITDPSLAPKGNENLMFLIPLAPGLEDTNEMREKYFDIVLKRLKDLTGNDIEKNIIFKKSYCVNDFEKDYNSFKGNAYGLANTLRQTAVLKPRMRNKKIKNLYYTGQLTVPGPGVPPSIISGQIAAIEIDKYLNKL
ncbi:MAG: phytoene desaturase [Flavobacteriales bacterium]|nr:phytoene desaturase [Flavobacteriales bacterium]MBL6869993.1 phytoene desaturase [Flavobacteriales bacterium]